MTIPSRIPASAAFVALGVLVACGAGGARSAGEAGAGGTSSRASGGASAGGSSNVGGGGAGAAGTSGKSSAGTGGASMRSSSTGGAGASGGGGHAAGGASGAQAGAGGSGAAGQQPGSGKLVDGAVFYQDIHAAALDGESAALIGALQTIGWGDAGHRTTLGIDFSFEINQADSTVARRSFTQPSDALPDCDTAAVPLPPLGKTEGSGDYACSGGDCHLLVYQGTRLYELYQADVTGG